MRTLFIAACAILLIGACEAWAGAEKANGTTITITITGVSGAKGHLSTAFFTDAGKWLKKGKSSLSRYVPASEGTVVVKIDGLPPGRYAVAVFHDENGNRNLDTNFLRIPREGYGFSGKGAGAFGPAKFVEAAFQVGKEPLSITIRMKY